jgi:hypothetical protein
MPQHSCHELRRRCRDVERITEVRRIRQHRALLRADVPFEIAIVDATWFSSTGRVRRNERISAVASMAASRQCRSASSLGERQTCSITK